MKPFIIMIISVTTAIATMQANAAGAENSCKDYDVFVLRHLEKQEDGTKDPSLTKAGKAQAQQLAELPMISDVGHAFYTPYKRTYETLEFIETDKTSYDPKQTDELIATIKREHCGKTVLVAGHSNTVPNIIKALGGNFTITYAGQKLDVEPTVLLSEKDYGSVFRVTFHNGRIHQQLYKLHYVGKEGRALQNR